MAQIRRIDENRDSYQMLKGGDFTSVTAKNEAFRKWYRDFFVNLQQNSKIMDYKTTIRTSA